MSNELVSLNLRKEVPLPQRIVLPSALMRWHGVERQLVISKTQQEVPAGVMSWMRNDARYANWFADPLLVEPMELQPSSKNADVKSDDESEMWSELDNVPHLRDYAKRHKVELENGDRKDAVVAKLRAAELPEGKSEDETPKP